MIVENPRPRPRIEVLAYSAFYTPVLLAALIGIYLRRRDLLRRDAVLWCVIGTFAAIHALYFPATRYRAPVEFVLLFYAAAPANELFRRALLPALDWATVWSPLAHPGGCDARSIPRCAGSVLAVSLLIAAPAAAQSRAWKPPRTPDGKPDLQGTFTFRTITPLQRPAALAGKDKLTPEEAAAFEASENLRLNRDTYDPEKGQPSAGYPPRSQGGVLSYNDFWYERGNQLTEDKRTSLIVDPPDGRIPFAPRKAAAARGARPLRRAREPQPRRPVPPRVQLRAADDLEHVQQQCADRPDARLRGHLQTEMVHEARIVPLDGRPHGTLPRWTGDSRGRWEGDTLVVETINFKRETSLPGSSAQTRLVERFTRVGPDTISTSSPSRIRRRSRGRGRR